MSNITRRDTTPRLGAPAEDRLARLLNSPSLARVVPHLPAETLHHLIRARGLDACIELVTSATPAQLASLLDLDLWRHARPGRDEQLDVDRFGEWLETLVDAGDALATRTVAAIDTNLIVAALSRYIRVFDPGTFEPTAQSDDEQRSETIGNSLECEVAGYVVRARRQDAWDAVVTLLVALDAEHSDYFHALMHGCRRLSNSAPEIDGLDDLLLAPEQHLHEVAVERERRRSHQGYATPADARAFLQMAREPHEARAQAAATRTQNPIVTAYFRAANEAPEPAPSSETTPGFDAEGHARLQAGAIAEPAESIEAILELLVEAGVMPERPRALLEAADGDPQASRLAHVRRLMAYLRDADENGYLARSRELAFLANALVAGCSVQSRPFTPQEASDAAAAVCNLGLDYWPGRWPGASHHDALSPDAMRRESLPPDTLLVDHDLVTAFEVGWSVLYHDVALFAAAQLVSVLGTLDCADIDLRRGLAALRRTLRKALDAGAPWRAREAAEVLAMLDPTAWIGVLGVIAECPVVPAALTAVLERRTTAISPTEFEFIATAAQVGDVRAFMRRLPDLLSN